MTLLKHRGCPKLGQIVFYSPTLGGSTSLAFRNVEKATGSAVTLSVSGWRSEPRKLIRGRSKWLRIVHNGFLIMSTSLFFIFSGFVIKYNSSPSRHITAMIYDASRYGPTIFPLMFAFIVGGAVRSFALWRLQEGEKASSLDLLLGSTSVASTIATQYELRSLSVVGFLLIFFWVLSPVGGQASLRVVNFKIRAEPQIQTLQYPSNDNWGYNAIGDIGVTRVLINTLFSSALMAPVTSQNATMDLWGNMHVPMIEHLPGYDSSINEWLDVDYSKQVPVFASLLGTPIFELPALGNTSFSIETSYLNLDCPVLAGINGSSNLNSTDAILPLITLIVNGTAADGKDSVLNSQLGAEAFWGAMGSNDAQFNPKRCFGNDTTVEIPARWIQFFGFDGISAGSSATSGTFANCTIATTYVEADVTCQNFNCSVTRMRRSIQQPHLSSNFTVLDDSCATDLDLPPNYRSSMRVNAFIDGFLKVIPTTRGAEPSPIQGYFIDKNNPFNASELVKLAPLHGLSQKSFATSLAQLLNTFWGATVAADVLSATNPKTLPTTRSIFGPMKVSSVQGTVSINEQIMFYSSGWLAMLLIATLFMFAAAVAKLIMDCYIDTPDLLMNVSTMTRNNPNVDQPTDGSTFGDVERSRILGDVKVRFGDVDAENSEVGHLGIGTCEEDGGHTVRIMPDRNYS